MVIFCNYPTGICLCCNSCLLCLIFSLCTSKKIPATCLRVIEESSVASLLPSLLKAEQTLFPQLPTACPFYSLLPSWWHPMHSLHLAGAFLVLENSDMTLQMESQMFQDTQPGGYGFTYAAHKYLCWLSMLQGLAHVEFIVHQDIPVLFCKTKQLVPNLNCCLLGLFPPRHKS